MRPFWVRSSRCEHGSHSLMPRSRTGPTSNSCPTRWFNGTPRVVTFRRAAPRYNRCLCRFRDDRVCVDFEEHPWIEKAGDLHHRRRRSDVAEELRMGAADGLPVIHVRKEDAGPHDLVETSPGFRQGRLDLAEDVDRLAIRVLRGNDTTVLIHGGRARDGDPGTDANGPRIPDDRLPLRTRRNVLAFHAVRPQRTMVGLAKNPRLHLATVRGPQELREFLGGLIREFGGSLPTREIPPVPFLEVTDDPQQVRLEAVMGSPIVQCGTDDELTTDGHDSEFVVSHGGSGIPARTPDARLDEIPDDGQQALEGLRLDWQVTARRKSHEGFPGAIEQVHGDGAGGFQQAPSLPHGTLRRRLSGRMVFTTTGDGGWCRGRRFRAPSVVPMEVALLRRNRVPAI